MIFDRSNEISIPPFFDDKRFFYLLGRHLSVSPGYEDPAYHLPVSFAMVVILGASKYRQIEFNNRGIILM